jgi:ABC-type uncharacterized transport system permease subunit
MKKLVNCIAGVATAYVVFRCWEQPSWASIVTLLIGAVMIWFFRGLATSRDDNTIILIYGVIFAGISALLFGFIFLFEGKEVPLTIAGLYVTIGWLLLALTPNHFQNPRSDTKHFKDYGTK